MRVWFYILLGTLTLKAGDEQQLALQRRAEADFERVETTGSPQLADAEACTQSEAAWLAVALPAEAPRAHYRKGYCALAGAVITHNAAAFEAAASEFDKAGGPAVFSVLARLQFNGVDEPAIRKALAQTDCHCDRAQQAVGQWLGIMDLRRGDRVAAARDFQAASAVAWQHDVAGHRAFELHKYKEAASEYQAAIEVWDHERQSPVVGMFERLKPPHGISEALIGLGGAQLLAGDAGAAILTLDRAAKSEPVEARAYYLRALAEDIEGRSEQALADYNLASRTAFAAAQDLASGDAHLYRGILLYRRKDFSKAEDEFASALNFNIDADLKPDAAAWRHLAAVANGACQASREALGRALGRVSPFFPADEATRRMNACQAETCFTPRSICYSSGIWHPEASIKSSCWATWARTPKPSSHQAESPELRLRWRPTAVGRINNQANGRRKPIGIAWCFGDRRIWPITC